MSLILTLRGEYNAALLALALPLLAACTTTSSPPPPVAVVDGPKIPASRFDLGVKPLPPDPAAVGTQAGSAAARYETRLNAYADRCVANLAAVKLQLLPAGQVVGAPGK